MRRLDFEFEFHSIFETPANDQTTAQMAAGSMKSFYRQKKRGGISKSKAEALISSKKNASSASHASASNLRDVHDQHEDAIRQFDLNTRYGPCIGMSRLDRWERANKLGMNPPQDIESLLKSSIIGADCVFEGRL